MLKKIGILLILLTSGYVYAGNEQITNRSVLKFVTYEQYVVVNVTPAITHTQEGCTSMNSSVVIRFAGDTEPKKEMFSAALAAAMAGKTIGFGINGCFAGYPNVYRVEITLN